jgi:hypothetical protein
MQLEEVRRKMLFASIAGITNPFYFATKYSKARVTNLSAVPTAGRRQAGSRQRGWVRSRVKSIPLAGCMRQAGGG